MKYTTQILSPNDWSDYELIDSGNGLKLERFGSYIVSRPDPRAIWETKADKKTWDNAHASYIRTSNDEGHWDIKNPPSDNWSINYKDIIFTLKPTSFKHLGIFPEQVKNWDWLESFGDLSQTRVLNLFAYTGGATMFLAKNNAQVTHVDSSKSTTEWAKQNVIASKLENKPIRWIVDDAYGFVKREINRKKTYDAIVLDPPRFGRGPKGEIWKIENHLPRLLNACKEILSPNPKFILINAYTADLSPLVLANLITDMTPNLKGISEYGELAIADSTEGRLLPNGIFARWSAL